MGLGKRFDQRREVGIPCKHDGNIKEVGGCKPEAGTGDSHVDFFFLEDGNEAVEIVGPGLAFLETANVESYFVGGKGAHVELVAAIFAGVFMAEVFGKGGEIMDRCALGSVADELEGGVAKSGKIEPLEGGSGEVLFGGLDGVVEVEAVDEKCDAGSYGTGHGGRYGKEKTRRPQPTGGCGAFG